MWALNGHAHSLGREGVYISDLLRQLRSPRDIPGSVDDFSVRSGRGGGGAERHKEGAVEKNWTFPYCQQCNGSIETCHHYRFLGPLETSFTISATTPTIEDNKFTL